MSIWMCRPSLSGWETKINDKKGYILDGDIIIPINTENLQKSTLKAFNECNWETGRNFNFGEQDIFEVEEYEEYFDVYVSCKTF